MVLDRYDELEAQNFVVIALRSESLKREGAECELGLKKIIGEFESKTI